MVKLRDVCEFINGDRGKNYPSQEEISNQGDVLFINAGHIVDGKIDLSQMNYVSKEKAAQLNSGRVQEDDILYCLRGSLGKKAIVKDVADGIIASSLVIIRPCRGVVNSSYLFYALESPAIQEQMLKANNGSSQPNLSVKSVGEFRFSLPDLEEQDKIVKEIDATTKLIKYRKQQLEKLEELVKARFVELFGDPIMNPRGLPIHLLGNHILFLTSGSRGWSQYFTDTGEYFITIKNVKGCRISLENVQYVLPPQNAEATRTRVEEGDLLISITADLGRTGVVSKEIAEHGAYINQHLTCIRLDRKVLHPMYVAYYLESAAGKEQFDAKNQNGVKAGLNFNAINSLHLLIPSISEQKDFVAFVEQTDKSKAGIKKSLEQLEMLKKALMQKYFG